MQDRYIGQIFIFLSLVLINDSIFVLFTEGIDSSNITVFIMDK